MAAVASRHPREQCALATASDAERPATILGVVSQNKLVVRLEIAHDILWCVGTKHFRHSGLRPLLINPGMASAAGFRPEVCGLILIPMNSLFSGGLRGSTHCLGPM